MGLSVSCLCSEILIAGWMYENFGKLLFPLYFDLIFSFSESVSKFFICNCGNIYIYMYKLEDQEKSDASLYQHVVCTKEDKFGCFAFFLFCAFWSIIFLCCFVCKESARKMINEGKSKKERKWKRGEFKA